MRRGLNFSNFFGYVYYTRINFEIQVFFEKGAYYEQ